MDDRDEIEVIYLDNEDIELDDTSLAEEEEEDGASFIEEDVTDKSQSTFIKHTNSVFCCDLSKSGHMAVSGGQDDMAFIWDTSSLEVLMECSGHRDSVTEVCFNYDDKLVATGDMSGLIQVWDVKNKKLLWCHEGADLTCLKWHPHVNILVAGMETGEVYIWNIHDGKCKVFSSHGFGVSCLQILADGKRIVAGYNDGQIKLWDIKNCQMTWQLKEICKNGITCLDVSADDTLIIVGPSASIIKVSDGKLLQKIFGDDEENDVEAVIFNSERGLIAIGCISGHLYLWDCVRNVIRHRAKLESSVTMIKWGPKDTLYVSAADGAVYVCDTRTGMLLETLSGHKSDVFSMALCMKNGLLVTASDDSTVKLFKLKTD